MRKYIRNLMRAEARRMCVKPSEYVKNRFDELQIKRYGKTRRLINQAKGTHSGYKWEQRIKFYI